MKKDTKKEEDIQNKISTRNILIQADDNTGDNTGNNSGDEGGENTGN